jgi:hypothetical protein
VATLVLYWDPRLLQLVTVNVRDDNSVYLVDGQHRMLAAREKGLTELVAMVWYGLSVKQEAALFLYLNQRRLPQKSIGRWKAAIVAEDPLVVAMDDLLHQYGYRVYAESKANDPKAITCPHAFLELAPNGDLARVRRVLEFISQTWPDDPMGIDVTVLKGTDLFLRKYGPVLDYRTAVRKLSVIPESTLLREAAVLRGGNRLRAAEAFCRVVQEYYDRGRRDGRLVKGDS